MQLDYYFSFIIVNIFKTKQFGCVSIFQLFFSKAKNWHECYVEEIHRIENILMILEAIKKLKIYHGTWLVQKTLL